MSSVWSFYGFLYRLGRKSVIRGTELSVVLGSRAERRSILAKIERALRIIETYCPVRSQDIRRQFAGILVTGISGVGSHIALSRICILDFDYVLSETTTSTTLAGTIIHELTHARLANCGFAYTPSNRARIERLCLRAELVLACRAPEGAALKEEAQRFLSRSDEFWSVESQRSRDMEKLEELGGAAQIAYRISAFAMRLFRGPAI